MIEHQENQMLMVQAEHKQIAHHFAKQGKNNSKAFTAPY